MKLLVNFFIIFSFSTMAMDLNKLLRDVQREITKDVQEADTITLISKEGQKFTLLNDVAKQAETIKSMMQDVLDDKRELPLQNISGVTLNEIAQLLHQLYLSRDIQNEKKLLDALEEKVKITDPFLLLAAANYLDIPPILNFAARAVARDEFKQSSFLKKSGLNKKIAALFGAGRKDIMPLIAHYYFLLNEKKLQGVSEDSYGFSVQDYLDYLPHLIKFSSHQDKPLDFGLSAPINGLMCNLALLKLRSLNGLQNVPNIHNVQHLTLQQNNLQVINAKDLRGLNSLIVLDLMINQLGEINFPPLPNLQFLALQENQLKEVPNTISLLPSLKRIILNQNPLSKSVDPSVFIGKHGLSISIAKGQFSPQSIAAIKAVDPSIRIFESGLFSVKEH